jgi:hypothetical protein
MHWLRERWQGLSGRVWRVWHPYGVPLTRLGFHGRRWRYLARQAAKWDTSWVPWSRIRVVGNSPAVRLAAAFPFVGHLILLNRQVADFVNVYAPFNVFINDPVPWNLVLIYFGSIATGAGAIGYALRCPVVHKRYDTFAAYRNEEHVLYRDRAFAERKLAAFDKELKRDLPLEGGTQGTISSRNHKYITDIQAMIGSSERTDEFLYREWAIMDECRPYARAFCVAAYGLGLGLFAYPSMRTFYRVLNFTFEQLPAG